MSVIFPSGVTASAIAASSFHSLVITNDGLYGWAAVSEVGYDAMPSTRTVDVHISGLRQKLEDNPHHPQFFLTIHGLGHKFAD